MKLLIVEDDAFKFAKLHRTVVSNYPGASIQRASSLQEAMNTLSGTCFAAVLLDMALPSHAGEDSTSDIYSQPVGGLDILLYLSSMGRHERVMILTQYPTVEFNRQHIPLNKLKDHLIADDINNLFSAVLFSDDFDWQSKLKLFLGEIH